MNLYTIGFTQKSAEKFFGLITESHIQLLVDVRLWNSTQLAGFSKGSDLKYFLKAICGCDYAHNIALAPTKELLEGYKNGTVSWGEYERIFRDIIEKRRSIDRFTEVYPRENICLLCAEPTAERCHRRLVAEMVAEKFSGITIGHI